ncbi:phosphatase PAP2 family protein [Acinetobacter stercoris]|nr:phosphatase PAP2 family protein [Acinetobacter stercoris]
MMTRNRFFALQIFFIGITFLILYFSFPVGGKVDMYFIQPWVNATGQFPLREDWFLKNINHGLFKDIIYAIYSIFLLLWCISFKIKKYRPKRWLYAYMFLVSIIAASIVGVIKSHSSHACPWNMTHQTPYGYIWDFSATHGHCFPGGHASTGFILITGFFVYRLTNKKIAYVFLIAGIMAGFGMGWGQMMRGAHFLSHNLWTGWIVWIVNVIFYALCYSKLVKFNSYKFSLSQQETATLSHDLAV